MKKLTVIIPVLNEAANLELLYKELVKVLPVNSGLLFIDDASEDSSITILEKLKRKDENIKILRFQERVGLGASVLAGIRASQSKTILVMDSDLTHNPNDIPRILKGLDFASLVIGSRYVKGGSMQPYTLYITSKIFAETLRLVFKIKTHDIFGGFLAFRRMDFLEFFIDRNFQGFGEFSMKMCLFAEIKNLSIQEIPSVFRPRGGGVKKSQRMKMFCDYLLSTAHYKLEIRRNFKT